MKKNAITLDFLLDFMSDYTTRYIIDYNEITSFLTYENDIIQKIIDTLKEVNHSYSVDNVRRYYLEPYFGKDMNNAFFPIIDLTAFLDFAVYDFDNFKNDLYYELNL